MLPFPLEPSWMLSCQYAKRYTGIKSTTLSLKVLSFGSAVVDTRGAIM